MAEQVGLRKGCTSARAFAGHPGFHGMRAPGHFFGSHGGCYEHGPHAHTSPAGAGAAQGNALIRLGLFKAKVLATIIAGGPDGQWAQKTAPAKGPGGRLDGMAGEGIGAGLVYQNSISFVGFTADGSRARFIIASYEQPREGMHGPAGIRMAKRCTWSSSLVCLGEGEAAELRFQPDGAGAWRLTLVSSEKSGEPSVMVRAEPITPRRP